MAKSKMCESCVHTKVCLKDKNLIGDVFFPASPWFFDNKSHYERFKEWEKEGFPCDDYMGVVKCECEFGKNHEQGDSLFESSDWDGGIGFDYIRGIKYCPICGGLLSGGEE